MDYRLEAGLWVALSLALYGLWSNYLAPLWAAKKPEALWGEVLQEIALGLYFLGIPVIALIRGAILPRFMGFTHLDWLGGIGPSIQAALFFALLLLVIGLIRGRIDPGEADPGSALLTLKQAFYLQLHWAFYRAFAIAFLGLPTGTLIGWVLALGEGLLSFREKLKPSILFHLGSLAVATGVVFLFSRNFFYCLALHWLLSEMMRRLRR